MWRLISHPGSGICWSSRPEQSWATNPALGRLAVFIGHKPTLNTSSDNSGVNCHLSPPELTLTLFLAGFHTVSSSCLWHLVLFLLYAGTTNCYYQSKVGLYDHTTPYTSHLQVVVFVLMSNLPLPLISWTGAERTTPAADLTQSILSDQFSPLWTLSSWRHSSLLSLYLLLVSVKPNCLSWLEFSLLISVQCWNN